MKYIAVYSTPEGFYSTKRYNSLQALIDDLEAGEPSYNNWILISASILPTNEEIV